MSVPYRVDIEKRIIDHIGPQPGATTEQMVRATLDRLTLEDCLALAEEQAAKGTAGLWPVHKLITEALDRLEIWILAHV